MKTFFSIISIALGVALYIADWIDNPLINAVLNISLIVNGIVLFVVDVRDDKRKKLKEAEYLSKLRESKNTLAEYRENFTGDRETGQYFEEIFKCEKEEKREKAIYLGELLKKVIPASDKILANFRLARNYHELADHTEAIKYYNRTFQLSDRFPSKDEATRLQASINFNMGWLENTRGNSIKSIYHFQETQKLVSKINPVDSLLVQELAGALNGIAEIYHKNSTFDKAIQVLNNANELYKKINDPVGQAQVLCNFGRVYRDKRQDKQAIEYFELAESLAKIQNHKGMLADIYVCLGNVYEHIDTDRAEGFYVKSIRLYREIGERIGEAASLGCLGMLEFRKANYPRSLKFHEQALELNKIGKMNDGMGTNYSNIANCFIALGNLPGAKMNIDLAIKHHEKSNYVNGLAADFFILSDYYYRVGNHVECTKNLRITRELFLKVGNTIEARNAEDRLNNLFK